MSSLSIKACIILVGKGMSSPAEIKTFCLPFWREDSVPWINLNPKLRSSWSIRSLGQGVNGQQVLGRNRLQSMLSRVLTFLAMNTGSSCSFNVFFTTLATNAMSKLMSCPHGVEQHVVYSIYHRDTLVLPYRRGERIAVRR